jgi:PAS domain S-box-containing protein
MCVREEHPPLYRLVFEVSPDGIILSTPDGSIVDADSQACRTLRRTRKEIVSTSLDTIFDLCDPRVRPAREQQRRTGRFEGTLCLVHRDGTPLPARVSITVCQDRETGEGIVLPLRGIAAGSERTEQTLHESEGYFRRLVDNALDMIVVADADGMLRYANPATERILGYAPENVVGTKGYNYIHPADFQKTAMSFAEAMSGPGSSVALREIRCRHADGSWRYLEVFIHNMLNDHYVKGMLFTIRDVTERNELKEMVCRVSQILKDLGKQYVAQLDAAVAGSQSKEQMLSESKERLLGLADELIDNLHNVLDDELTIEQSSGTVLLRDLSLDAEPTGEPTHSSDMRRMPQPPAELLTPREFEVLKLLAQGRTNQEIARSLVISLGTAKLHVHHVITKLGVSNRTQAVLLAIGLGLLQNM